ncbi:hypothetical protein CcaCcLH18_10110 [Colletotrichum camelliae]|nr:hypothetical protein CcaCcLH18_10110 [Colletotrichum camelliae]
MVRILKRQYSQGLGDVQDGSLQRIFGTPEIFEQPMLQRGLGTGLLHVFGGSKREENMRETSGFQGGMEIAWD